mmetsp:Transcript_11792/g.17572  ORF Transcript_11792/g.17572 Transcript_11792/m.17572 type:complete len:209 (-) Transcript_11792:968-1594(-)
MMIGNLPFTIFVGVYVGITTACFGSIFKGEFVNSSILSPIRSNLNIPLQNLTRRFLLQKPNKIISNTIIGIPSLITQSRQQNRILRITVRNLLRITRLECIIPQPKKRPHFLFRYLDRSHSFLWHERRMMMANHPFSIFERVHETIARLDFGSVIKSEFVYTSILCPVIANEYFTLEDFSGGMFFEKAYKVILDSFKVIAWYIGQGWE